MTDCFCVLGSNDCALEVFVSVSSDTDVEAVATIFACLVEVSKDCCKPQSLLRSYKAKVVATHLKAKIVEARVATASSLLASIRS